MMADKLQAALRPVDERRCFQLLAAWDDGDKQALDLVMDETVTDPNGTAGLLFALLTFAAALGEATTENYRDRLTEWLLDCAAREEGDGGEGR